MIDKDRFYKIIFESNTAKGKQFDVALLWVILVSIVVAAIDSMPALPYWIDITLDITEWVLTLGFTAEYLTRIYVSPMPRKYIFSFWGIVDLIAILPGYFSLFFFGYQYLLVVRVLRLLRVFRILKLVRFNTEAMWLIKSLKASIYKISIFLSAVLVTVIILGTVMYVIEGGNNGFSSIPQSIYWAIITITTVGYGDIVPYTMLGKFVSSLIMLIGYAIIAIPTGIVTVEMSRRHEHKQICSSCNEKNDENANYCSQCGCMLERKLQK
jgi:voltage-gated potassium channel